MQHSVNIVLLGKTKPRKCFHATLVETFASPVHQIAKSLHLRKRESASGSITVFALLKFV